MNDDLITEEVYQSAIPKCCRLTTLEAHNDIMLCWGLKESIRNETPMVCGWCEFNNEHTKEEYDHWLREELSRQRVWKILNA